MVEEAEFATTCAALSSLRTPKVFNGGPFYRKIVCVHTDEPVVMPDELRVAAAAGPTNAPYSNSGRNMLLSSYDPHTHS